MISLSLFTVSCLSIASVASARTLAQPVIQHIAARSQYLGGWPLALSTSPGVTCPASASVACPTTEINPTCCPTGNTCNWASSQFTNYCCPTADDCLEAVLNFPRCASDNQTMFKNGDGGFYCCNPGEIAMNPSTGKEGGLCEPADQTVPKSELATIATQFGIAAATQTPTATATGSNPATATGGGGGNPTETNPSGAATTSVSPTTGMTTVTSNINKWPMATKIGVGVGVLAFFVIFCVVLSICRSRRRRNRNVIPGAYGYDEFGNRVDGYGAGYVQRPGYEPYRPVHSPSPAPPNHVTVNVVQGDLNQ
ncbi:hypothetical protein N431DRAFT_488588 [Stipitochalara longipes BDJ]|nr:hypothetical protein N431DRAFT_488588 [Stipitochalara longipes BDJ]